MKSFLLKGYGVYLYLLVKCSALQVAHKKIYIISNSIDNKP